MLENKNENECKRTILFSSSEFEVVAIEWSDKNISYEHSHGWSKCSVLVQEGVFENTSLLNGKNEIQIFEPGQVIQTPISAKHSLKCLSSKGKTLHVYTPRLENSLQNLNFKTNKIENFDEKLSLQNPTNLDELKNILKAIQANSISTYSPYFMNQLFSGVSPQMLIAAEIIAQQKTTLATNEASPVFSAVESEIVGKIGALVGWPSRKVEGVCVPGGSSANFMALHCARQRYSPDIKKYGVTGQRFKVYVSSEAHYSFKKANAVLGLGTENLVSVPVDVLGRMRADSLEELILQHQKEGSTPLLVCATAGTTVLGAFDKIDELAFVTKRHQLWLHVDGAWGGPAIFSKNIKNLVSGIEQADSLTFDAHKLFGASMVCSFFVTQQKGILLEANDVTGGDYLFHSDDANLDRGKLSWQCGRGPDALSFWSIWKSFGTEGMGQFVDQLIELRKSTQDWVKNQNRLELIGEPQYLNLCVRVLPPESMQADDVETKKKWSQKVREDLKIKNQALVNYSANEEGTFLRLIFANPDLKLSHVQQIFQWALDVK